jgi:hypothetical protein
VAANGRKRGRKNVDAALIMALAAGGSVPAVAAHAGCGARTAYRRLQDPAVAILVGALVGGFAGYMAGMYLACYLLWPQSNLCGLAGVFITGPVGLVAGGAAAAGGISRRR